MTQQTFDLGVNPSEETIRVGPLTIRFLLTGENSTGTVAALSSPSLALKVCPHQPIATTITRRLSTVSTAC
jgi:hypothetical protein